MDSRESLAVLPRISHYYWPQKIESQKIEIVYNGRSSNAISESIMANVNCESFECLHASECVYV